MTTGKDEYMSEEQLISAMRKVTLQTNGAEREWRPVINVSKRQGFRGIRDQMDKGIMSYYFEGTPAIGPFRNWAIANWAKSCGSLWRVFRSREKGVRKVVHTNEHPEAEDSDREDDRTTNNQSIEEANTTEGKGDQPPGGTGTKPPEEGRILGRGHTNSTAELGEQHDLGLSTRQNTILRMITGAQGTVLHLQNGLFPQLQRELDLNTMAGEVEDTLSSKTSAADNTGDQNQMLLGVKLLQQLE
ncbi:hypothetical protein R1sor_006168 [Riccia sorocarpa]|uniref:Uncharacterized protein n=1 Tax=Riccia sorocarpa TaxID=122646 RepID=A0ABD3HQ62_9MARC